MITSGSLPDLSFEKMSNDFNNQHSYYETSNDVKSFETDFTCET